MPLGDVTIEPINIVTVSAAVVVKLKSAICPTLESDSFVGVLSARVPLTTEGSVAVKDIESSGELLGVMVTL